MGANSNGNSGNDMFPIFGKTNLLAKIGKNFSLY